MRVIIAVILIIGFCSFNKNQSSTDTRNGNAKDTAVIHKYQKQLLTATGYEKEFLIKLINTIRKFESKKLDTTIIQIGQFDSNIPEDTIRTRIYEKMDSIYLSSVWRKNGVILWSHTIENPYTWIGESKLFQYDTRDKWVIFTIAIYQSLPEIDKLTENGDAFMSVENGLEDLKSLGITMTREDYKNYILNYKGDLIIVPGVAVMDGAFIWYKPAKRFLLYYHE
jgi:hypothetical protein